MFASYKTLEAKLNESEKSNDDRLNHLRQMQEEIEKMK
jgi:hypothetical protein